MNAFHATVGLHQEKGWKHLPVVCPLTSPWALWWPCTLGVAETAASGGQRKSDMEEGQPCIELPQVLQKHMAGAVSGQWFTPSPCPNCHNSEPLCAPGVQASSQHGQCKLGAAPGVSPARQAQPGTLGSVSSPKPLFLTFLPHFRSK